MKTALADATKILLDSGVPSPSVDAELLASFTLGISKGELTTLSISGFELTELDLESYLKLVRRRASREPLQHITGIAHFRNIELKVGPGVFVPRPETEQLVEFAAELIADKSDPLVVDLCAGSGAVAISMATEIPGANVFAVEKSVEAGKYLQENFRSYGLSGTNIRIGDLSVELENSGQSFDLVVSNPPYIPTAAVPIYEEVRLFDPPLALYGGEDGLDVIRSISKRAAFLLKSSGVLVLEHGEQQAEAIGELLLADGWINILSRQDLTGRDRMTSAQKR